MRARLSIISLLALCALAIATILFARLVIGPADLYEKDQPKTLAYTADILLNDRLALPRDVIYQPATKPPLYNWIAAGVMWITGSWSELAMKSPSVIGALGVGVLLIRAASRSTLSTHAQSNRLEAITLGSLATAIWFAYGIDFRHGSTTRLLFLARPDMLQAFFVTAAWFFATLTFLPRFRGEGTPEAHGPTDPSPDVRPPSAISHWVPGMLFWLCVSAAVLTKGPLALLVVVYAFVAARLLGGSWKSIARLHPIVGGVGALLIVGTWFFFAYRTDPDHVKHVMLGAEIIERVTEQTPEGISKPFYFSAMWFVTKGGPFSLLAIGAAVFLARRERSWLFASALWLGVLLAGLSLPSGKRIDYLLPTYAPASLLAAAMVLAMARRARVPIALAGFLPLAAAVLLARANLKTFHEAREHWSDHAIAFTSAIRERVASTEPLLVVVRGKHPLTTLLRQHHGSALNVRQIAEARWVVMPLIDTLATPAVRSELLPLGFETIETRSLGVIGLFDMQSSDAPTRDEIIRAQKRVGDWTSDENPYRAPGTVWRE